MLIKVDPMKNITSILGALSVLVFSTDLVAQLPYTSSNSVPWHESRMYEIQENMELNGMTVPMITEGTGVIWDLTSIPLGNSYDHTVYFEPASVTPYYSSFPNSNIAAWETDVFGNSDYNYFNNSPFELRLLGAVHVENGTPQNIEFCPDPFLVMNYPMSVGSGVQQVYSCPEMQGEIDNWVIMATGTVLYDGGAIENLVQWRSIFTGPGYADTSYFWTQAGNVLYPVVRYLPGAYLRVRKPVSQTVLAIEDANDIAEATVFPNPATDQLVIRSAGFNGDDAQWIVRDALGRVVQANSGKGISEQITLNVGDLKAGIYTVELITGDGAALRRSFARE